MLSPNRGKHIYTTITPLLGNIVEEEVKSLSNRAWGRHCEMLSSRYDVAIDHGPMGPVVT